MAQPAFPLRASTVVLLRPDAQDGFEVFMNRRPEKMQSYAGVYVFPGGCVETSDYSPEMIRLTQGLAPAEAKAALKSNLEPEVCLGYWVAAVRELFEEAGIHFFVAADKPGIANGPSRLERLLAKRGALQTGELTLARLLDSELLRVDVSRLAYFSHRITPEHYKIRFDTRFFLAALPAQQSPLHSSEEVAESLWIRPQAALERTLSGGFPLMPPTIAVLRTLAEHGSWQTLSAAFALEASSTPAIF
jgi:8-oxo-dGTP pyrophosphatase MutT (NUDIX family)